MNLTDNEIIKVLENCFNNDFDKCEDCPLKGKLNETFDCLGTKQKLVLELINRLKATNELSAKQVVDLKVKDKEQQTHIERLHEVINGLEEQSHKELLKFVALSEKDTDAKAEIERLNIRNKTLTAITKNYDWKFAKAKAEAIKEFAERLKEKEIRAFNVNNYNNHTYVDVQCIDNLVKEVVGE